MSNKLIPSHWAISIIFVLVLIVSSYILKSNQNIKYETALSNTGVTQIKEVKNTKCSTRAFKGEAEVRVWQEKKDGKVIIQVVQNDLSKLPNGNAKNFQLIDTTPDLQKKLDASSEKNPVAIKISGFTTLCDGTALASLDYKDGIFRSYLVN